jgi:nucleotide-binding universal stress UspA family protein/quercetin dioxygenase-like cupin family protein
MPSIQTILHPTDFSENSQCAFETACALARDYHATLLVLHVAMPSESPVIEARLPDPLRPIETQRSRMYLPWPQASDPQISLEHRLAEGDAAEEILRLADAQNCDLIVMGSHGKTGLARLLTGSVAEEVMRKSIRPVMVIKNPFCPKPAAQIEVTANPGDAVDVRPLGPSLASAHTRPLIRTTTVEVVRLVVRAGQEIPQHASQGEIIVHCLEGRVAFTALGKTQVLEAGTLLDLPASKPHSIKGIEDASLLLTTVLPKH